MTKGNSPAAQDEVRPSTFKEYLTLQTVCIRPEDTCEDVSSLDLTRPMSLISAEMEGNDKTEVDHGNREMFMVRQTAEDGSCHVVLLSEASVRELMHHMQSWLSLG